SHHGKWLVRIEVLDPPREMPGAADLILNTLQTDHLYWDGEVVYQRQRHALYQAQIAHGLASGQAYYCQCTRKQIKEDGGYYPGSCRNSDHCQGAIRLKMTHPVSAFVDLKHVKISIPAALVDEYFIIKRRDGLFAC
ncbi:glutamate--tRNA ligase family protein, partial [Vibrio sp. S234-5]|uniref:glutamate--tRNA ligase family protein n=1 Tax=Vibrio sp. S234-5 TaxID=1616781 RepID=UPI0005F06EBA